MSEPQVIVEYQTDDEALYLSITSMGEDGHTVRVKLPPAQLSEHITTCSSWLMAWVQRQPGT